MQQTTFTATEARQKFFTLLRMVEKGNDAFIVAKDRNLTFKITTVTAKPTNKRLVVQKMAGCGLKIQSWDTIKPILEHRVSP